MAATARERRLTVDGIGARARRVVLLTATPHAGDDEGFASLCSLGQLGCEGPPVLFRRTAAAAGVLRDRRVRLLRVALTPAETALHALLDRYSRLVWDEAHGQDAGSARLAMIVLRKRALSSVAAVVQSIGCRLAGLGERDASASVQLILPLADETEGEADSDDEVPASLLSIPGLSNVEEERKVLAGLLEAAKLATAHDSKTAVLARLLGRIDESAIVFTEYRDTALALADALAPVTSVVVLHGGLDRAGRREVEQLFLCGRARVLVATDAAGQGLNLQARCRFVVNLELPWNPMRLEQRIGRVDRIGQTRRVHAVNLVAGGTAEEAILGRLIRRLARIREAVGHDSDPVGLASRIAEAVIVPDPSIADPLARLCATARTQDGPTALSDRTVRPAADLTGLACCEFERLCTVRSIFRPPNPSLARLVADLRAALETTAPWALIVERSGSLAPGVLCILRLCLIDARGRLLEEMLLPVHADVRVPVHPAGTARYRVKALLELGGTLLPVLCEHARAAAGVRLAALAPDVSAASQKARDRDAAIARLMARQLREETGSPVQAGLFDQRELRQAAARRLAGARLTLDLEHRRASNGHAETLSLAGQPEPMLVLWIAPER
jgi:hypothetical protein